MRKRTSLGLLMALAIAVTMHAMLGAQQAGSNVNVLPVYPPGNSSPPFPPPGISDTDELKGDGYLQRQVEPVVAASSLNPDHLVAAFGDFRTVDIPNDIGVPGAGVGAAAEGWIGYSRSYDRGKRWYGAMVPGVPGGTSPADTSSPLFGLTTGSDPVIATTPGGHFYIGGLFFTRDRLSNIAVMHLRDVPDLDGGDSIQPGKITIVDRGSNSSEGNFEDKPSMAGDIPRRTTDPSACGPVYMAYTIFNGGTTGAFTAKVGFSRSKQGKCGEAWDNPTYLNKNYKQNQGTAMAIDPNTGKIYVIWRHFFVPGGDGFPDAIVMSTSTDFGGSFSAPVTITPPSFKPFDQYTISTKSCPDQNGSTCPVASRSPAFPAITVDGSGNVYVAIQEQIPITVPNKPGYSEPRITLRTSRDGGKTWTVPASIIEAGPGPGSQQVMPALSFGGGLLKAMWYDYRRPEWANQNDGRWGRLSAPIVGVAPACTATTPCWYMVGLDRQMETRIAQSVAGEYTTGNPVFSASAPVSNYLLKGGKQYLYPATSDNGQTSQVNRPNLPMYASGTTAFTGDYITLNPAWQFERNQGAGNPFRFTTHPLDYMAMSSLAVWTDTRDVAAPNGNVFDIGPSGWPNYGPVGTGAASCINPGARNQNIFFSEVKPGVIAASPATSRQLVDSGGKPFERAFPLYVQNATPTTAADGSIVPRYFRLTFQADSPTTVLGSFVQGQFADPNNLPLPPAIVTSVDAGILPYSTSSKTIYVYCASCTSANAFAPFSVKVDEITAPQGNVIDNGLKAIVRFNNDPTAPFVANLDLGTKEIHDVSVSTPQYSDPQYSDPQYSDPQYSDPQYSDPQYSDPQYSDPQYSDMQPVGDFVWTAQDVGNNASAYNARVNLSPTVLASLGGDKKYRLFITRAYNRAGFSTTSCDSRPLPRDQIISVIPLDFSDPQYSDPQYSDPQYSDPQYSDASFATVPPPDGATAMSTASATTMAAVSSPAATTPIRSSGDAPIEHDKIFIVLRVYGPAGSDSLNDTPGLVEQVLANASTTVTPQAGNTESNGNGGTLITPPVPTSDKAFTMTTLTSNTGTSFGQAVIFTANVGPQGDDPLTGSVAFREVDADGNEISVLADVLIDENGNATFSKSDFSVGTHYLNAIFSGNENYNGSLSNTLTTIAVALTDQISMLNTDFVSFGFGGMRPNDTGTPTVPGTNGTGTIAVSGITGSVTGAILYWHGPTQSPNTAVNSLVSFAGQQITGVNLGVAHDNNWAPYTNSHTYAADVTSLVTGNGGYALSDFVKDQGEVRVADINGVSLIVFFNDGNAANNRDVYLRAMNDSNIVLGPEPADWSQSLSGINYAAGDEALLQVHVGDGQGFGDDGIRLNGIVTVDPGPNFQGTSVQNEPASVGLGSGAGGLWDIRQWVIPAGVLTPGPNTVALTSGTANDALSLVVMLISVGPPPPIVIP